MNIELLLGIFGATTILLAFGMNQTNRWKNNDIQYDLVNFLGSVFLSLSALLGANWPFLILNIVWAVFSGKDVVKFLIKKISSR